MSRETYVIRNGELVAKFGPLDIRPIPARSDLACPMVIGDNLADVKSPIDGKPFSSKSAYYKHVRAADCEIMGNDPSASKIRTPHDDGPDFSADLAETVNAMM